MKRISLLCLFATSLAWAACGGSDTQCTAVGPAGGTVAGPDGVLLVIPAGALTADTCISIRQAGGVPQGFLPAGPLYEFQPHGLVFQSPVSLTLPYQPGLVQGDVADLRLWMADTLGGIYVPLAGTVDETLHWVTTTLGHFSYGGLGTPDPNCQPQCAGRVCGPDACGGTCGPGCSGSTPDCDDATGQCLCVPHCTGRECGPDGCGGVCEPGCGGSLCNESVGLCVECGNGYCDLGENPAVCPADCPPTSELDLLYVIDNSGSMAGEQALLRANFPAFLTQLRDAAGNLPDLHIGVTTTDLGTGMFQIPNCMDVGGDAGNLVRGSCQNPTGGKNYIIDVEPQSCEITKDANGACTAHTCDQTNCAHEPTTSFVVDTQSNCPRCRNYQNQSVEDVFGCIADLGTQGCGFEQPLESMYKALDPANTANVGFVRPDSVLAVVLLTDEDDCSASTPQLFDSTMTDINSTLGPLTSFRCFEFGITCDINSRTSQGARHDCVPRDDTAALLYPVDRYVNQLLSIHDPGRLVVAAIAGPVTPSSGGIGYDVVVGLDNSSFPELQYSCTTAADGAVPGIRLHSLVSAFNTPADLDDWAYSSVCSADYTGPLAGIGQQLGLFFE